MTTIFRGNIVHTPRLGELKTIPRGYLVLEDGVIDGLYDHLPHRYDGVPVEDWGDRLIMQSFADMHVHAPQYAMEAIGMDLPLLEWLQTYAFPTEARYADTEFARRTYRRLARELISWGTTRVAMFSSLHTDATLILMEELEKAGICGYVGKVNMDRNGGENLQETTEESLRETVRWLDSCHFAHIHPIITPRFTPSCTDELMRGLGKLGRERGLYVQSHLSENLSEMEWVRQLHPDCRRYWETYQKFGMWRSHTIMAHCVHSDVREQEAIRDANVLVAHCAASNVNLCSGTAPVREMLDRGLWVALGSDVAGGDHLSMARNIEHAIRASKIRRIESNWHTPFLTVAEGLYLGTTAGHRYFGAGNGFAKGDKLHAIVVDDSALPEGVRELTVRERAERLVYQMRQEFITAVYSDSRRVR